VLPAQFAVFRQAHLRVTMCPPSAELRQSAFDVLHPPVHANYTCLGQIVDRPGTDLVFWKLAVPEVLVADSYVFFALFLTSRSILGESFRPAVRNSFLCFMPDGTN